VKLLTTTKDGGAKSTVWAHWLFELKSLASVVLLRFEDGSREAYHEHAFDCISWVVRGELEEHVLAQDVTGPDTVNRYPASWRPVITRRNTFHKVVSHGRTWVISFRGPWADTWREFIPSERRFARLTHGRREVGVV
jgi:hypothetical protein